MFFIELLIRQLFTTVRYSNIFVTAPSPENLKAVHEFIFKGFEALHYQVCTLLYASLLGVFLLVMGWIKFYSDESFFAGREGVVAKC